MTKETRSLMMVVAVLVCSIGCVQYSHRSQTAGLPKTLEVSKEGLEEIQLRYKTATLDLDQFARKELLAQESPPDYYLQAVLKMQKMELSTLAGFQEFNRLHAIVNGYHAQQLALGMKSKQKTPLQIHRFLPEFTRLENHANELQARCFSLLQQKQQHQVAFLFATDSH